MLKCSSKSYSNRYLLSCTLLLWTDLLITETVITNIGGFLHCSTEKLNLEVIWHTNLVGLLKKRKQNSGFNYNILPSPSSHFMLSWFATDKWPWWVFSLGNEYIPFSFVCCRKDSCGWCRSREWEGTVVPRGRGQLRCYLLQQEMSSGC